MSFYSQTIDFLDAAAKTKDAAKLAQAARDVVLSCVRRFCAWKGVTVGEDDTLIELIHLPVLEEFVGTAEAVSALVEGEGGSELVKMFDARMLRIEVAVVKGTKNAEKDIASIRKTAKALLRLGSIAEIAGVCFKELGTKEDFEKENEDNEGRSVAGFLRSLVGLDQKAINERFGSFLTDANLTADQETFIAEVIDYLKVNGEITIRDLNEKSPFNEFNLAEIFENRMDVFKRLKETIKSIETMEVA